MLTKGRHFFIIYKIIIIFYNTHTISTPIAPNHPSGSTRHIWTPARRQPAAPLHLQYRPNHQHTAADFRSPLLIAHHPDAAVRSFSIPITVPTSIYHPTGYIPEPKRYLFPVYIRNTLPFLPISYISTLQKTPYFIKMHIILYI